MKKIFSLLLALTFIVISALSVCAAPATEAGTVYDLVANFENLEDQGFSLAERAADGTLTPFGEWSDGTTNIVSATHEKPMVGYYSTTRAKGDMNVANHALFYTAGDAAKALKWYPATTTQTVVVFTAPVAGTYSYEYQTQGIWGYINSATRIYVEVGGEVKNEQTFETGTAKDQSIANFKGTVELKAGETIYLGYDIVDTSAGDNSFLQVAKVTLDEVSVEEPPVTNDALVAVIALAAVAGTAIVVSKKR
jgi:hypothetical protein